MKGMAAASEKVHRGIALYGQTAALKMEAYAKANRRWHDRTASARQTIKGISGWGYISADISTRSPTLQVTGSSNVISRRVLPPPLSRFPAISSARERLRESLA